MVSLFRRQGGHAMTTNRHDVPSVDASGAGRRERTDPILECRSRHTPPTGRFWRT
ncbi:MAG: hypothetical protein M0R03_02660 [Novosphingobium sp.]|nr:hypothetical protein [Novosphingobium sp.]